MSTDRQPRIAALIMKMAERFPENNTGYLEDLLKIISGAVEGDAFALLHTVPDLGRIDLLAGFDLDPRSHEREGPVDAPSLLREISAVHDGPTMSLKGPFRDDPFLCEEGARRLLVTRRVAPLSKIN